MQFELDRDGLAGFDSHSPKTLEFPDRPGDITDQTAHIQLNNFFGSDIALVRQICADRQFTTDGNFSIARADILVTEAGVREPMAEIKQWFLATIQMERGHTQRGLGGSDCYIVDVHNVVWSGWLAGIFLVVIDRYLANHAGKRNRQFARR